MASDSEATREGTQEGTGRMKSSAIQPTFIAEIRNMIEGDNNLDLVDSTLLELAATRIGKIIHKDPYVMDKEHKIISLYIEFLEFLCEKRILSDHHILERATLFFTKATSSWIGNLILFFLDAKLKMDQIMMLKTFVPKAGAEQLEKFTEYTKMKAKEFYALLDGEGVIAAESVDENTIVGLKDHLMALGKKDKTIPPMVLNYFTRLDHLRPNAEALAALPVSGPSGPEPFPISWNFSALCS